MTTRLGEMRANGAAVGMNMPSARTYSRPGQSGAPGEDNNNLLLPRAKRQVAMDAVDEP
jgi:hypothetical protein